MDYDPDLFGKALPCLSAIGCALPPDYSLSSSLDGDLLKNSGEADGDGPYQPRPIEAEGIQITAELNNLIVKFSEHYHDAWARRKLENGWKYGEGYSWHDKIHPRLKPYPKLTEYVS
jgi:ryanodine receptor 2